MIAGVLTLVVCLGTIGWGFVADVRDSSPPSVMMEGRPEIVKDDVIGVEGIRDLTAAKVQFLGLIVVAGIAVAGGAISQVGRQQRLAGVGIWLGAIVLFGCGAATIRTFGMPLIAAAMLAFITALASSMSGIAGGVTPVAAERRRFQ